jgi:hypothetical protein
MIPPPRRDDVLNYLDKKKEKSRSKSKSPIRSVAFSNNAPRVGDYDYLSPDKNYSGKMSRMFN